MFPWNYGFHWSPGNVIFLGAFYGVLLALAATILTAAMRSRRDVLRQREADIRWLSAFEDLPAGERVCRHVLTGEFRSRVCAHAFDCRECATHARLMEKHPLPPASEREEEIFGMVFPLDRFYHRGHTWAHLEPDGTVTVGLDDLAGRLMSAPDSIELPPSGTRVHANGAAFRVHKRDADVRVLCPVDGEVVETGGRDRGWYLRIRPDRLDFRHLLRGSEIKPWLLREMDRLQMALSRDGAIATLADGGVPVADIAASYPEADWDAVCGEMFLQA